MRFFSLKREAPLSPAGDAGTLPEQPYYKNVPYHQNIPYEQSLAEQLHSRLLNLDFPAFALCLCRLLQALGYQDVHLAGRREWKGYNKPGGGGYDLEATLHGSLLPGPLSARRVIVQIKQFDGLHVHQRSVDELRGTCLRVGAAEALLITTSAFSKVVRAGATAPGNAGSPVAPVRLMDREELIALLIHHFLGVKKDKSSTIKNLKGKKLAGKRWEIDDTFFAELTLASAILSKEALTERQKSTKTPNSAPMQSTTSRESTTLRKSTPSKKDFMQWRVTVRISSNPEAQKQKETNRKENSRKGGD